LLSSSAKNPVSPPELSQAHQAPDHQECLFLRADRRLSSSSNMLSTHAVLCCVPARQRAATRELARMAQEEERQGAARWGLPPPAEGPTFEQWSGSGEERGWGASRLRDAGPVSRREVRT
jgi:hypothetical protein